MTRRDLHTHTTFCDGKDTPEAMVQEAIRKNMTCIGFSGHSYTFFDESYCMSQSGTEAYQREIRRLKSVYGNRIQILCGLEQDFYSTASTDGFDYIIGSVHYLKAGEHYIPVDESPEILKSAAKNYYGGDIYLLVEDYFSTVAQVVTKTGASIIGHFDLITKFNDQEPLFDESHPRYEAAWKKALDTLLLLQVPFEINTGAISRGYKALPYPAPRILGYIRDRGGKTIMTSDSHQKETLCFAFDQYQL